MGRRTRIAVAVVLPSVGVMAGILFGLQQALHQAPDFYQAAVVMPITQQKEAGHQFERTLLALHNDLHQEGRWQHVFTAEQINGWLAVHLPRKFPTLLPATICEPRIALHPQRIQVASQFVGEQLSAVISLHLEVGLADEPNTLAVRICQARAGWVPVPLKNFLDQVGQAAQRANIVLRWAHSDGDPVALVTIPTDTDLNDGKRVVLDAIEIREGDLVLGGHTDTTTTDRRDDGGTIRR